MTEPSPDTDDSNAPHNPYATTARGMNVPPAVNDLNPLPMATGVACAVAVFYGAFFAAVIAVGLSIFILMPPMNHWFDLDGEFDGLIIFLMPPLAAGCSVFSGLTFGLARRKAWRLRAAVILAAVISSGFTTLSLIGNSHLVGTLTVAGVLFTAMVCSVLLLSPVFRHIEKRRAEAARRRDQGVDGNCLFYITNDRTATPEEIVFTCNDRCEQENLIEQLKNGPRSLTAPVDNLYSNWAYMLMASLGWTLKAWIALSLPETGRWKDSRRKEKRELLRMEFRTFVTAMIRIPCQIVRTGRRLIFRLLNGNNRQPTFWRLVDALQL